MKQEIKIGNIYTGIGSVGMSKDKQITGTLIEYNPQHDTAVLRDDKGRVHEVIYKALELVGLHTGKLDRWENNTSIDYKKYLNNFSLVMLDEVEMKAKHLLKEMPVANAHIKCVNMIQCYKDQANKERQEFWTKVKAALTKVNNTTE